jgi:hypothetical protein
MAKSNQDQRQKLAPTDFPDNIPWLDLWCIADAIEDQNIQRCFTEALWCLRISATNASIVVGWSAVVQKLRTAFERLPDSVRESYKTRYARRGLRLDDGDFLKLCRKLRLFGLMDDDTSVKDRVLSDFHTRRTTSAHAAQMVKHGEVAEYLVKCGAWYLRSPIDALAKFANYEIVLELAREQQILQRLNDIEVRQIIDFVLAEQLPPLADVLLGVYLQHAVPDMLEDAEMHGDAQGPEVTNRIDEQLKEWSKIDANLCGFWNEVYRRLDVPSKIPLLDRLVNEFADALHSRPIASSEQIDLIPSEDASPIGIGRRSLSELACLLAWKQEPVAGERPHHRYRDYFFKCFAASPRELFSLPDDVKRDLLAESPAQYVEILKEAF